MSSEKSGLPPTPTTTPRMSGSSERPARRLHRSNSEDRNMTSSDSGNADTLKVMSNSLQLAQTRARKAQQFPFPLSPRRRFLVALTRFLW